MKKITILGAGPVGVLLAVLLARRGHRVDLYEKRPDPRTHPPKDGRSINLALSERGLRALRAVGLQEVVQGCTVPMTGRLLHGADGGRTFQPYGRDNQCIYSVSRHRLNEILLAHAADYPGITVHFGARCRRVDLDQPSVHVEEGEGARTTRREVASDVLFGADGAFSLVRETMQQRNLSVCTRQPSHYGYQELRIPARPGTGQPAMTREVLHIWPRGKFMLIALPNTDGSFTGTLFMPLHGPVSFASLAGAGAARAFLDAHFPDLRGMGPQLAESLAAAPVSSLFTVACYPWCYGGKVALIGDASHCMLPFYGQGMNTGFEDCLTLDEMLAGCGPDWAPGLERYQARRQPDAEFITRLSSDNFTEMSEKVRSPDFLLRKEIEAYLHQLFPQAWLPLYSMVAFSSLPFTQVAALNARQGRVLDEIMRVENIATTWRELNYQPFLEHLAQ
jgi:kynurenine 3-monooxygenase